MHTDPTLSIMENVTSLLGDKLRHFHRDTCAAFSTRELQKEATARCRRQAITKISQSQVRSDHNASNTCPTPSLELPINPESTCQPCTSSLQSAQPSLEPPGDPEAASQRLVLTSRRLKGLNLNTYKIHALGDYVNTIRNYGTTDSYSTELVCALVLSLLHFIEHLIGRT